MNPEQPINSQPADNQPVSNQPSTGLPVNNSNKRKYYLIGGLVLLLIVIVFILGLFFQPKAEQIAENSADTTPGPQTETVQVPTTIPEPTGVVVLYSPESTTKGFYEWYVNHPAPLTSGSFKTRPDITEKYKSIMARYGSRGIDPNRDPIFKCGGGKPPKNVGIKPADYHGSTTQALVTIAEGSATGKELYLIKLEKQGEFWYVRDVWCAPKP